MRVNLLVNFLWTHETVNTPLKIKRQKETTHTDSIIYKPYMRLISFEKYEGTQR